MPRQAFSVTACQWLYTASWLCCCLSSVLALLFGRADKHRWNPLRVLPLVLLGIGRHIFLFVFWGLGFLWLLQVLEIEEGEHYLPGLVVTGLPMLYFIRSIHLSRKKSKMGKEL